MFNLPSTFFSAGAGIFAIYLAIANLEEVHGQTTPRFPSYSQMCQDDAGPPFADDDETFGPGGKYHDGSAAFPVLVGPGANQCPPPLQAACSSRGPKTAYLEGPIDCGGKGWYCRILQDSTFDGINLATDYNAHHCNNTEARPDDLHCHGGSVDETFYWWVRDHWYRQYNGRLRCCCDWDQLRTERRITPRCDYRRLIQPGGADECRDANEDNDPNNYPLFEAGCAQESTGPISEDDSKCWEVGKFGYEENAVTNRPTAKPTTDPNVYPYCDWQCYLNRYDDLQRAFGNDQSRAQQHFINSGNSEGRDCTCCVYSCYLSRYPDLEAAFGNDEKLAAQHYINSGFTEGRDCTACSTTRPTVTPTARPTTNEYPYCDWQCYLNRYADLQQAFGNDQSRAQQHFINSGNSEGRDCTCCVYSCYLSRYPDLQAAFGNDEKQAAQHYINSGFTEGRDCTCV